MFDLVLGIDLCGRVPCERNIALGFCGIVWEVSLRADVCEKI